MTDTRFSLSTALKILSDEGFGENSRIALLQDMNSKGLIKSCDMQGKYVLQSELNKAIDNFS